MYYYAEKPPQHEEWNDFKGAKVRKKLRNAIYFPEKGRKTLQK